jgi:hypothetical protein
MSHSNSRFRINQKTSLKITNNSESILRSTKIIYCRRNEQFSAHSIFGRYVAERYAALRRVV